VKHGATGNANLHMMPETLRLTLRPFNPADADELYSLNNDPEVIRHTGDEHLHSREEAALLIADYDQYEKYRMGRLAVIKKGTGHFLGWCGLKFHPATSMTDLGFRFHKRFWGQGYATEASLAYLRYGFDTLGLKVITGCTLKENTASISVLGKIGMLHIENAMFHGAPGIVFIISRERFATLQKALQIQQPDNKKGSGSGKNP